MNILTLSSLAMTIACDKTEGQSAKIRTINAVIVQPETKTSLEGPDADGIYKTDWSSGDEIMVFTGNLVACRFTLKSGENTNRGVFEGYTDSDNNLVAIYPLSIAHSRTGGAINVGLPEVQEYVSGNIPQGAYPMLGTYSDETFSFSNLCSVIKVPMFGDVTVKSITFTPNNASVKASGNAVVKTISTKLEMAPDANSSVKLDCPDVKLSAEPTDFHFVVPAQKYPGGFTLTISTDQGDVIKSVESDVTLSRSVLYPIKAFECKIDQSKENIVFEDANFKAYMVANFDTDNDGEISFKEALEVTKIEVNTDNIESLVGIEHMTNLLDLICKGTHIVENGREVGFGILKSLDVSQNIHLQHLDCDFNQLSSLNVNNNKNLEQLFCNWNKISALDISNNPVIARLGFSSNQLSTIDLSKATKLRILYAGDNNLSSIDISNNTSLRYLHCYENNLYSLDISNNPELRHLLCYDNHLTTLNISNCHDLTNLFCQNNPLETLYIFRKQVDAIEHKNIPSTTKIIDSAVDSGNNDTTTGDKIRLE